MKIGVIGSGPAGASAALTFLNAGYAVHLFDLGFKDSTSTDIEFLRTSPNTSKFKLLDGEIFPYDLNEFNLISGPIQEKSWFTSKALGGFSTVWGATWSPFEALITKDWQSAYKKANEMVFPALEDSYPPGRSFSQIDVSEICSCFDFLASDTFEYKSRKSVFWNIRISSSSLAVSSNSCIACGKCQSGCPTSAIWSSKELIRKCNSFANFEIITGSFVKTFSEESDGVNLNTSNGVVKVDILYIACGPVATGALILRSAHGSGSLALSDTRMITIPFLRLRSNKAHEGSFSLSGREIRFLSKDAIATSAYLQLYAHVDEFSDRVKGQFPKFLGRFIEFALSLLSSRLYVGLLYLDSRISGSLRLSLGAGLVVEPQGLGALPKNMTKIVQAMTALRSHYGLWPIWKFAKIGAVGDSYHLGRLTGVEISENGELNNSRRIFVVGSAGLSEIEPGPITMTAMAHAIKTAVNHIEQLPKF